ncbi:MAG TPA: MipA/OmpV family protein [Burkholderiales bacterium]|nr:MipA/OmpV family protein [Burkholderiales bacterium]
MRCVLLAALLASAALAPGARAELRPKWEAGAGATGLRLPDYRGSDETREYVFPLPYFVYRGQYMRFDREGLRGVLHESDRVEFDLSVAGSLPVKSDRNRARAGMPDLDPALEIGPKLNVTLWRDRPKEQRLDLRFALRGVVATDLSHAKDAGYVFHPHLYFDSRPAFLGGKWDFSAQLGPLYGSERYHQYYYGVAPQFATPERPAFEASAGYSGLVSGAALTRRFGKLWVGGFARYDALDGAVFESSPLFRRRQYVAAGVAVAWVFAESKDRVEVDD